MAIRQYASGDVIYRAGQKSPPACMILSGEVLLSSEDGERLLLAGSVFGERAALSGSLAEETATARGDVSLQEYDSQALDRAVAECPPEIQKILEGMCREPVHKPNGAPTQTNDSGNAIHGFQEALGGLVRALGEQNHALMQRIGLAEGNEAAAQQEHEVLTSALLQELSDLGPIMPLLNDESINDVLINGTESIYVERHGKLEKTDIVLPSESQALEIANKIVKCVGRQLNPRRPLVDARLLDGSRVNIIAPPLAVDGTVISIRKFSQKKITLDSMVEKHNVSAGLGEFMKVCGRCRLNIVISGGTGAGKTTLLNALSQHIDVTERIVTIEDAAELQLQQPHVVRLETRPLTSGIARDEEVTMRDLVKNALRMRPDRIIVGEVRGPEAFDMMQAMNTGHEGSLTTIHANHPRDALSRLENMVSMANLQIPTKSIRYQVASALHLIIQISRMRDGHRRITHISEIVGMEGDVITMHDLFNYTVKGEDAQGRIIGNFEWSGIMPRFIRRVAYYGEKERLEKALGVKLPQKL